MVRWRGLEHTGRGDQTSQPLGFASYSTHILKLVIYLYLESLRSVRTLYVGFGDPSQSLWKAFNSFL